MGCTRWLEEGLLFSAGELTQSASINFRQHLAECPECGLEASEYEELRTRFFTSDILHEPTPQHVDQEILRVCSKRPRVQLMIPGFFTSFRKTAFSAAFLLVGFVGVGYYTYVVQGAKGTPVEAASRNASTNASVVSSPAPELADVQQNMALTQDSSTTDSLRSARPFSATQGNLSDDRVMTVGTHRE